MVQVNSNKFNNWVDVQVEIYKPFISNDYNKFLKYHNNSGRKYSFYAIYNNNVVEITVAALVIKKELQVKAVYVEIEGGYYFYRCMDYKGTAGWIVDWTDEGKKSRYSYYYVTVYSKANGWSSGKCNLWTEYIDTLWDSRKIITRLDKYKYSGIDNNNFTLAYKYSMIDYLKDYTNNPKLELIEKSGLGIFANSKRAIKLIEKDSNFLKYLLANKDSFKGNCGINFIKYCYDKYPTYSFDIVNKAYLMTNSSKHCDKVVSFLIANHTRVNEYIETNKINIADYIEFLDHSIELGKNLEDTKEIYPIDWLRKHDLIIEEYVTLCNHRDEEKNKEISAKMEDIANKYNFIENTINGYLFVLARSVGDLKIEGAIQHICVGAFGYDKKVVEHKSLIVFCRKIKNTPLVCIEIDAKTGDILQARGNHNCSPESEIMDAINAWNSQTKNKIAKLYREVA